MIVKPTDRCTRDLRQRSTWVRPPITTRSTSAVIDVGYGHALVNLANGYVGASSHDEEQVMNLVLGVARLGEAGLRGWWQSHGLDQAGQYVLGGHARDLPRTSARRSDVDESTYRPRPAGYRALIVTAVYTGMRQ
jgi:hypothetical protein